MHAGVQYGVAGGGVDGIGHGDDVDELQAMLQLLDVTARAVAAAFPVVGHVLVPFEVMVVVAAAGVVLVLEPQPKKATTQPQPPQRPGTETGFVQARAGRIQAALRLRQSFAVAMNGAVMWSLMAMAAAVEEVVVARHEQVVPAWWQW